MTREPDQRHRHSSLLVNTSAETGTSGVQWKLTDPDRDLDANIVELAPGSEIAIHTGAEVDVLLHVLEGSGSLNTDSDATALTPGSILLLPRGSRRGFTAGPSGLRYLSVHQRRESLRLGPIGGSR